MDHIFDGKGNIRHRWRGPHPVEGIPSVQGQAEVSAIRFSPASLSDLSSLPGQRRITVQGFSLL